MHRTSSRFKICGRSPSSLQGGKISKEWQIKSTVDEKILQDIL
jgi:hypothetical protein